MKFEVLWILVVLLIIVGVWAIRFVQKTHIGAAVYAIALILIVQFQALSAWPFGAVYSNPDKAKNYDLYRAAVQMVRLFGRYATPVHRVMLWYSGKDLAAWSIASTVLVYDVNKPYQLEGGLPDIGHYEMSRLNSPDLKYVMMISTNPELIKNGKNALMYHGYEHRDIEERKIGGANFETNLDLVEIIPSAREKAMAHARSVPLASMKVAGPSASLQPTIAGIAFRSAPVMWSYIGQMPLHAACIDGGGWVAVDIGVSQGLIGVGVLNRKGDGFLARVPVLRSDKSQTVFLRLDSFGAAGEFLVQNWNVNSPSQGILHAVRLAAESGGTPQACGSGEISRP